MVDVKQNAHIPGGSVANLVSLTRTNSSSPEHRLRRNKATAIDVGNFRVIMEDDKLVLGASSILICADIDTNNTGTLRKFTDHFAGWLSARKNSETFF